MWISNPCIFINCIIFIVSCIENKNEEEYFNEVMHRDDTGNIILNRLNNNNLPVFYAPVSKYLH